METSYRCDTKAYPESPSARILWRLADKEPPPTTKQEGPLDTDAEALKAPERTFFADSTRISAREENAQHSLSIAYVVEPERIGPDRPGGAGGRPAVKRQPVIGRGGSETQLWEALSEAGVSKLVTDGQMDVSGVADRFGRCRWHSFGSTPTLRRRC